MAAKSVLVLFPIRVIPGASAVLTIAASGTGLEFPEFATWEDIILHIDTSAVSGTTPNLTFILEEQDPVSGVWVALVLNPAIAAIVATGHQRCIIGRSSQTPYGTRLRLRWVVTGTTPSFTVLVSATVISASDPVPNV